MDFASPLGLVYPHGVQVRLRQWAYDHEMDLLVLGMATATVIAWAAITAPVVVRLQANAAAVEAQAAALNRLAAAQEADTELTRRYMRFLPDAEGER